MATKWFRTRIYNYETKSWELERYNFNTVYSEKNLGATGDDEALAIWKYNSENLFSLESRFTTRLPENGETAVATIKAVSKDLVVNFAPSGELSSYNVKHIILFMHYNSIESDYSYEIGKSIVFPASGIDVDYLKVLSGEAEPLMAEEKASYIDFYYHSLGREDGGDYKHKHRHTFLDESQRTSLLSFSGVAGDFDERWWETIDLSGDYQYVGTSKNDVLEAYSGVNFGDDLMDGRAGDDELIGYRGADVMTGGLGNDLLKAGNGRDVFTGGPGADILYGGFGHNTFIGEKDGSVDWLYFKSDQFSENWIYGKAGNNPNGQKADVFKELDSFDQIIMQGVQTSDISFRQVDNFSTPTGEFSGVGIFAKDFLEAIYIGTDLSITQLKSMTTGVLLG